MNDVDRRSAIDPIGDVQGAGDDWSRQAFEDTLREQGFDVAPPAVAAESDEPPDALEAWWTSAAEPEVEPVVAREATPEVGVVEGDLVAEAPAMEVAASEHEVEVPETPPVLTPRQWPMTPPLVAAAVAPPPPVAPAVAAATGPVAPSTLPDARPPGPPAFLAARVVRTGTPVVEPVVVEPTAEIAEAPPAAAVDDEAEAAGVVEVVDAWAPAPAETDAAPDVDDALAPVVLDDAAPDDAAPGDAASAGADVDAADVADADAPVLVEPAGPVLPDGTWTVPAAAAASSDERVEFVGYEPGGPDLLDVDAAPIATAETSADADPWRDLPTPSTTATDPWADLSLDDPWAAQAAVDREASAEPRPPFTFEEPVVATAVASATIGASDEEHAVAAVAEEQALNEAAADTVGTVDVEPQAAPAAPVTAEPATPGSPPEGSLRGLGRRPPVPPGEGETRSSELWGLVTDPQAAAAAAAAPRAGRSTSVLLTLLVALVVLVLVAGFVVMFTDLL